MYVDLVDALRCPHAHADSWLVAASYETRGRCIHRGVLGCPVCEAQFPIADGVATFDGPADDLPAPHRDAGERAADAMRLAAFLGLTTPGGIVAVGGTWAPALDALLDLVDVRALAVAPAGGWETREPLGAVRGAVLPVAAGALRGVALDVATATPERLAAAVRALGPKGRLVAPAGVPVPEGVRELARDDELWVAEREDVVASAPVALRSRRGQ